MSETVLPKCFSCIFSLNPCDREDGSILILVTQMTMKELSEVRGHAQDVTTQVAEAEFKVRCVWLLTLCSQM